jgi:Rrf2 family protein
MRLGIGVESMLHSCVLLALLPSEKSLPAAKLAEYHDVPAAQMAKHLQALSAAGVLVSARGRAAGGYQLARPPEQITLLDIVDAVEGQEPLFRCTNVRLRGPCATDADKYGPMCPVTQAMRDIEQAWRQALASRTIADLVMASVEDSVPEVVSSSMVWLQKSMR